MFDSNTQQPSAAPASEYEPKEASFPMVRLTRFTSDEILTKTYTGKNGRVEKTGTGRFSNGHANVIEVPLNQIGSDGDPRSCNCYGIPKSPAPSTGIYPVVLKEVLAKGNHPPGTISRSKECFDCKPPVEPD